MGLGQTPGTCISKEFLSDPEIPGPGSGVRNHHSGIFDGSTLPSQPEWSRHYNSWGGRTLRTKVETKIVKIVLFFANYEVVMYELRKGV